MTIWSYDGIHFEIKMQLASAWLVGLKCPKDKLLYTDRGGW